VLDKAVDILKQQTAPEKWSHLPVPASEEAARKGGAEALRAPTCARLFGRWRGFPGNTSPCESATYSAAFTCAKIH